jgi:hypothetical protein
MKLIGFMGWMSAVTLAVACGSSGADGDGGESSGDPSGGANPQEIADCKSSCDQLKFFKCNDAQAQADCYDDCAGASSDQIELFVACVSNDTCDPECSTFLEPSGDPSGGDPSGGDPSGGNTTGSDATGDTCSSDGCNSDTACNEACESLQFFSCIDAATFDDCSALCKTASADDKGTFASCVSSGDVTSCDAVDCYYTFDPSAVPGPTPQQIADCKMTCEQLGFFDCLSGAEAAQCAASCDEATKEVIEGFLICASDPTDCAAAAECFD